MLLLRLKELIVLWGEKKTTSLSKFHIYILPSSCNFNEGFGMSAELEQNRVLSPPHIPVRYGAHLAPRDPQTQLEMLKRALDAGEGIGWDPILRQRSWK